MDNLKGALAIMMKVLGPQDPETKIMRERVRLAELSLH